MIGIKKDKGHKLKKKSEWSDKDKNEEEKVISDFEKRDQNHDRTMKMLET